MRTLSTDIEELGTKLLEDDQLILKMLSSLQHNNMLSPKLTSKTDVSKGDRHSKNISLTTITPKKRKSNQEKRYMSNTTKTVRRFNTQPTIVFERCSFPKMMRKQSTARSQTSSKRQKKMMKAEQYEIKNQSNMMKLKKMSQKMMPKVTNKFIYTKKSYIAHFEKTMN